MKHWLGHLVVVVFLLAVGWNWNDRAEAGLCVLRADYERRLGESEKYLADVNSGRRKLIPGLTKNDVRRGIAAYRSNIVALEDLHC